MDSQAEEEARKKGRGRKIEREEKEQAIKRHLGCGR